MQARYLLEEEILGCRISMSFFNFKICSHKVLSVTRILGTKGKGKQSFRFVISAPAHQFYIL